jgi:hypothetical protein
MSRIQRGTSSVLASPRPNSRELYLKTRYPTTGMSDTDVFAVNPIRRSFAISMVCWGMILVPILLLDGDLQASLLIGLGWLAAAGIVFVTPIFFWSLAEAGWERVRWRVSPTIEDLDLSPRAYNLLRRHGFDTISSVEETSDVSLMLLQNMDPRALHEIRRAVNLWKYRRWQEAGFPVDGAP